MGGTFFPREDPMHRLNAAVSKHQCEIKLKKKKKIVSPGLELSPEITIKMQV